MKFIKVTEQESNHKDLEKKSVIELVNAMHKEDNNALKAVNKVLPKISELIEAIAPKIEKGGRLFYIGAGTSGRLGVLDASECPPTFGTPPEKVVGLVAGGIPALYSSIEIAEDDTNQAWKDLSEHKVNSNDFVIGIAASGTTPYVVGGLKDCYENNISTFSLSFKGASSLSGDDIKLSERLYIPGRKLRGFERGKVGPKDGEDYIGGNFLTTANLSTTLPQILSNIQEVDVVMFLDAANIWGVDYDSSLDDSNKIRSSTGVAVDWFTPVGPLNFSLTQPISKASTDKTESFRFNLGTTF